MLVVHVDIHVKPEALQAFLAASRVNAAASLEEPGVRRFDVLQDEADPTHVVFSEAYVDQAAADAHRETAHFALWQQTAAGMLSEPRTRARFTPAFPGDDGW